MRDPSRCAPGWPQSTDEIAPVWVLDDPFDRASDQAIGIAERLGVPHLRVPLAWRWQARLPGLSRRGSLRGLLAPGWPFSAPRGPALAISASPRSEAVALWLRNGFGTRVVHCGLPRRRAGCSTCWWCRVICARRTPPTWCRCWASRTGCRRWCCRRRGCPGPGGCRICRAR